MPPPDPTKPTDEQLVELSLQNRDNFGALMARYEQKFINYIRRLSGANSQNAEDILQEAFIKIYLHLNDFDPALKFSSWGYRIVRNETFNHGRKNKDSTVLIDDELSEKIADAFDLTQNVDDKIFKEKLNAALLALDNKYREPLELFLLEEKSYEEISDILRRPVGTVGALISRGKQKLQNILKTYDHR